MLCVENNERNNSSPTCDRLGSLYETDFPVGCTSGSSSWVIFLVKKSAKKIWVHTAFNSTSFGTFHLQWSLRDGPHCDEITKS